MPLVPCAKRGYGGPIWSSSSSSGRAGSTRWPRAVPSERLAPQRRLSTAPVEVMEEALLLRDDGIALCARAHRREGHLHWHVLALWWLWAPGPPFSSLWRSGGAVPGAPWPCLAGGRGAEAPQCSTRPLHGAQGEKRPIASRCEQEMQALAAERALLPLCLCSAWCAWASSRHEVPRAASHPSSWHSGGGRKAGGEAFAGDETARMDGHQVVLALGALGVLPFHVPHPLSSSNLDLFSL